MRTLIEQRLDHSIGQQADASKGLSAKTNSTMLGAAFAKQYQSSKQPRKRVGKSRFIALLAE
jgi:hypothetical protein